MILLFILSGAVCLCKYISIQLIPPNSWKPDQMNKGVKFETHFMVAIMYLNLESTKAKADQRLMNCGYLVLSPGSWSEGMGWMSQKRSERKTRVSFELIITVGTWGLFPLRPLRNWEEMKLRTVPMQDEKVGHLPSDPVHSWVALIWELWVPIFHGSTLN